MFACFVLRLNNIKHGTKMAKVVLTGCITRTTPRHTSNHSAQILLRLLELRLAIRQLVRDGGEAVDHRLLTGVTQVGQVARGLAVLTLAG